MNEQPEEPEKKNLAKIIVPILVVLVATIVAAVVIFFVYKKYDISCIPCNKPDVQPDGLYTDIPSDGPIKTEIVK